MYSNIVIRIISFSITVKVIFSYNIYSFFVETNATKDSIVLQKGETISYKWVNRDGFIEYINSDEAIPSQRARLKKFLINENC